MYWARPIQVVRGQLFFQLILSGLVGYITLRYCSKRTISDDIVNNPCNIAHIWCTLINAVAISGGGGVFMFPITQFNKLNQNDH